MLFEEAIPCNTNSFSIHAIPTCNGQKMVANQYPYDRNVTDIQKKKTVFFLEETIPRNQNLNMNTIKNLSSLYIC